jgi:hypothetical protein
MMLALRSELLDEGVDETIGCERVPATPLGDLAAIGRFAVVDVLLGLVLVLLLSVARKRAGVGGLEIARGTLERSFAGAKGGEQRDEERRGNAY